MAITINTNVAAITAQRNLNATQMKLGGNLGRLSSGLRINTAADDAAGLAISERFRAQIRSFAQAERNAGDGVSLLQTAEGAMNEIGGVLTRLRELAMQSSNGTLGTSERGFINDEATALVAEIDRIAAVTEFNGSTLLDGTLNTDIQIGTGATANDSLNITVAQSDYATIAGAALDLSTQANAQTALGTIDTAIDAVSTRRAALGTAQNRLNVTVANLGTARESVSAANSRIVDADVAQESAELTRSNILLQAGISVLAQANAAPQIALNLLR